MYFVISASSETTATQIMAVATTRDEAFQAMYDVFRANIVLLKGGNFVIPGIEAVKDGWACCTDDIKCRITPDEVFIDYEGTQHWTNIASYDLPLWRLEEKSQEYPAPLTYQTSFILGEKNAQEEMRKRGAELAGKRLEGRAADVKDRGHHLSVDIGYARAEWNISPVEIN